MVRYNPKATKNLKGIFRASEIAAYHNIGPYGNPPKNRDRFLSVVRKQLNNGADPNVRFLSNNITPLMWAVKQNHLSLVKLLLRNGGDPLLKDSKGRTLFNQHYRPKGMSKKCREQAKNIIKNLRVVPIQRRYRKKYRVKTARKSLLKKSKLPEHVIDRITKKYLFDASNLPSWLKLPASSPPPLPPRPPKLRRQTAYTPAFLEDCSEERCDYRYLLKNGKIGPRSSVNKYCKDLGCERCAPPRRKKKRYCTRSKYDMNGLKSLFRRKKGLDKERDWQRQHGRKGRGSLYPPFLPFGAGIRGKKKKKHKR